MSSGGRLWGPRCSPHAQPWPRSAVRLPRDRAVGHSSEAGVWGRAAVPRAPGPAAESCVPATAPRGRDAPERRQRPCAGTPPSSPSWAAVPSWGPVLTTGALSPSHRRTSRHHPTMGLEV